MSVEASVFCVILLEKASMPSPRCPSSDAVKESCVLW